LKAARIMSGFEKDETTTAFVCRSCGKFLDAEDLVEGGCPICLTDETVFQNDLLEDSL